MNFSFFSCLLGNILTSVYLTADIRVGNIAWLTVTPNAFGYRVQGRTKGKFSDSFTVQVDRSGDN